MGSDDGQTQDQASEQKVPVMPPPKPQPESNVGQQWEAILREKEGMISGQKGHIGTLQEQLNKITEKLNAESQEKTQFAQKYSESETAKAQYEAMVEALKAQNAQLATENTAIKRQTEVQAKINREFPALASFYDKKLLKDNVEALSDDDLTTYLKTFQDSLGEVKTGHRREEYSGATPPPAPGDKKDSPGQTVEELMNGMNEAARKHGMRSEEYQNLFKLYQQALMTGKVSTSPSRSKSLTL